MRRRVRWDRVLALLLAALVLAGGIALAASGARMMPSYLAAWLFLLAFPVGALPLVMGMELAGAAALPAAAPLRRMLVLLPLAALFVVPVLLRPAALYDWMAHPPHGFAGLWYERRFFIARMVAGLVIWSVLALLFLRPPPARKAAGRGGLAALGLMLHFVIGTVAAIDWTMSVHLPLASSVVGLLLMAAQCSVAASAAALVTAARGGAAGGVGAGLAALVAALIGAWMFLHFTQFLVIWSADKPEEAAWYLHRSHGLGAAAEWLGLIAFVVALALLRRPVIPALLAAVAGVLLFTHLVEMLWLVTPGFRNRFTVSLPDALAMLGAVAVVAAMLVTFQPRQQGAGHGAA